MNIISAMVRFLKSALYIPFFQRYNMIFVSTFNPTSTVMFLVSRGTTCSLYSNSYLLLLHYCPPEVQYNLLIIHTPNPLLLLYLCTPVPCTASPTPYYYIPVLVSCNMILVQTVLPPNTTSLSIKCTHVPCTTGPAPTATSLSSRATTCSLPQQPEKG